MELNDTLMRQKLLLVDDVEDNLMILQDILEDLDVSIDACQSGVDALSLCSSNTYAAAIVDINMPGMNGIELVKQFKSDPKHETTPVVFITAFNTPDQIIGEAYEVGGLDYLQKPINEQQLKLKVKSLLRNEQKACRKKYLEDVFGIRDISLNSILDQVGEGVLLFNQDFEIIYCNKPASTLLTEPSVSIIGKHIKTYIDPGMTTQNWLRSDFSNIFFDGQCHQKDESFFWRNQESRFAVQYTQSTIHHNNQKMGIVFFHDDTERRKIQCELSHLANYDQLTSAANRTLFIRHLDQTLSSAKRHDRSFAVLIIDLDNFKEINDTYGHDVGDKVLAFVCNAIKHIVREEDMIARLGGDEFALILPNISDSFSPAVVAGKMQSNITAYPLSDHQVVPISFSIGIALNNTMTLTGETLLKNADLALYNAKNNAKGTYQFFSETIQKSIEERKVLIHELSNAIENNELDVVFQPQISFTNGQIYGLEALIRWNNPIKGSISPDIFIPMAEEVGMIEDIGQWCLNRVCQSVKEFQERGLISPDVAVSINISPYQLNDKDLFFKFLDALNKHNLSPGSIHIEVTESAVMSDVKLSIITLQQMRKAGVNVSIDDFGTGYSSLSYLKILPLDMLKIDQSFIKDIGVDKNDEAIIEAIIQLASSLGLTVIAEGVETPKQEAFLINRGCQYGQGYLYSKPLNTQQLSLFLEGYEKISLH